MLLETRRKLKAVMILAMVSAAAGTCNKAGIRFADAFESSRSSSSHRTGKQDAHQVSKKKYADATPETPLELEELQTVKSKRPSLLQVDQESAQGKVKYIPSMVRPPRRTAAQTAPSSAREKSSDMNMPTVRMTALPARPAHSAVRSGQPNMGLFGLGAPELAVIGVAVLFVLGPDNVKEMVKGLGKMSADLKELPEEFNKGMQEEVTRRETALKDASVPIEDETETAA